MISTVIQHMIRLYLTYTYMVNWSLLYAKAYELPTTAQQLMCVVDNINLRSGTVGSCL